MATRVEAAPSNVAPEFIAAIAIEAQQAQRDIDEATGRKRSILKRGKAGGIKNDILLTILSYKKMDELDVQAKLRDTIAYAAIITPHIRLTQADLFSSVPNKPLNVKTQGAVQDWDAEQKGYDCGLIGGTMDDCVFAPGTEGRVHFQRGHTRGMQVIADRMGENAKVADPARTKRRGKAAAAADDTEGPDDGN